MADNYFKVTVDDKGIQRLFDKYGQELTEKSVRVINKYTNKVSNEAKKIIDEYKYRDTGRLINSIKPSISIYTKKVVGEVNASTKYARYIHDGARHPTKESKNTERFFVPFKKAPSLYTWAKRNKVIETIDGVDRLTSTGQVVAPDKGGLLVHIAPTKYFEKPFNKYKKQFVKEISNIIDD